MHSIVVASSEIVVVVAGRIGGDAVVNLLTHASAYSIEIIRVCGEILLVAAAQSIESNILLAAAVGVVVKGINKAGGCWYTSPHSLLVAVAVAAGR